MKILKIHCNKLLCYFCFQFQNGVLNDICPAELNTLSNSQPTTHLQSLHHPSEGRPFPDLTSSGFL